METFSAMAVKSCLKEFSKLDFGYELISLTNTIHFGKEFKKIENGNKHSLKFPKGSPLDI